MYNIIGDIHGLDHWKKLVREDATNVFVGDYFDSKDGKSQEEIVANFQDIITFCKTHPGTILLYGNHDLNYLLDKDYKSRFSHPEYRETYRQLFAEAASFFYGVAYAIDDKTLVSHAGITGEWYEKYIGLYHGESPHVVARQINELWQRDKNAFTFSSKSIRMCTGYPLLIHPYGSARGYSRSIICLQKRLSCRSSVTPRKKTSPLSPTISFALTAFLTTPNHGLLNNI